MEQDKKCGCHEWYKRFDLKVDRNEKIWILFIGEMRKQNFIITEFWFLNVKYNYFGVCNVTLRKITLFTSASWLGLYFTAAKKIIVSAH